MRLILFGLLALVLLFGCAAQKTDQATGDKMEKPGDSLENPAGSTPKPTQPAATAPPTPPPPPDPDDTPEDTPVIIETPPEPEAPLESFTITAKNYAYNPANITVKKGSRVKLSITAVDRPYGFAIMDFGVNELIDLNETVVVSFIADKPGTHEIKNTHITSGSAYGMRGTLTVTE